MAPTFPLLYDIISEVRDEVQQPGSDAGDDSWFDREFTRKCRNVARKLLHELMDQDVNYQIKTTDLSVALGDMVTTLPVDCVGIVCVSEINAAGNWIRDINLSTWQQYLNRDGYIWMPTDGELRWTDPQHPAFTARLAYLYEPVPLAHGIARDGGVDFIQFAEHELATTGQYVGLEVFLVDGDGNGGVATGTAYDGPTRTLTIAPAWTAGSPAEGTIYSSRPPLPKVATEVFITLVVAELLRKYDKPRSLDLLRDSAEQIKSLKKTVSYAQRHQPRRVLSGHPADGDPYASRLGINAPGLWGG